MPIIFDHCYVATLTRVVCPSTNRLVELIVLNIGLDAQVIDAKVFTILVMM